jgi:hypothetical protein
MGNGRRSVCLQEFAASLIGVNDVNASTVPTQPLQQLLNIRKKRKSKNF